MRVNSRFHLLNPVPLFNRLLHRPFFIRLFHWEYWPFWAVYVWTAPAWFYFCLRTRSFFFFSASNPSIKNGGLIGESKKDIHNILPPDLIPATIHFSLNTAAELVLRDVAAAGLEFPLIGKPDIGGKGRGVKILRSHQELRAYSEKATLDFHIQQYVDFPEEIGVFYYRYPNQHKGRLTGIVGKKFLTVTGNGKDSLHQLLKDDRRGVMYLPSLENMHREKLEEVLPAGMEKIVSPFGNHARGSKFLDYSDRIDPVLTEVVDAFSKRIPGFYFGRFDIRFKSWDDLRAGKNFVIIELNGAGAEPTHMYDPRHSLFFAVKEIIRHWGIMCRIARMNHKLGVSYPSFREGVEIFTKDNTDAEKLAAMSD